MIELSEDLKDVGEYNSALAYTFAELSNQAYYDKDKIAEKFTGVIAIKFIEVKAKNPLRDVQAYVLITEDNDMVVAFQGSWEANDWLVNAKFGKTPPDNWIGNSKVHKGFSNAMFASDSENESVYNQIESLRKEYKANDVYLTGHSQGGAMANLYYAQKFQESLLNVASIKGVELAEDISSEDLIKFTKENEELMLKELSFIKGIYTYGEPRSLNKDGVNLFTSIDEVSNRFVHSIDIVSQIPPEIFGYKHFTDKIHLSRLSSQEFKELPFLEKTAEANRKRNGVQDHGMSNYIGLTKEEFLKNLLDLHNVEIVNQISTNEETSLNQVNMPPTYHYPAASTTNVPIHHPMGKN